MWRSPPWAARAAFFASIGHAGRYVINWQGYVTSLQCGCVASKVRWSFHVATRNGDSGDDPPTGAGIAYRLQINVAADNSETAWSRPLGTQGRRRIKREWQFFSGLEICGSRDHTTLRAAVQRQRAAGEAAGENWAGRLMR